MLKTSKIRSIKSYPNYIRLFIKKDEVSIQDLNSNNAYLRSNKESFDYYTIKLQVLDRINFSTYSKIHGTHGLPQDTSAIFWLDGEEVKSHKLNRDNIKQAIEFIYDGTKMGITFVDYDYLTDGIYKHYKIGGKVQDAKK